MFVDTHAHLDVKQYDKDRPQVIERAFNDGVERIINVSFDLQSAKKAIKLADEYKNIFVAVGCHPKTKEESGYVFAGSDFLEIVKHPKIVAIGECGLELLSSKIPEEQKKELLKYQKEIFEEQISLARELNLPLIVHCRNTHKEIIEILSKVGKMNGVIHCFSGSWRDARKYLEMGFYISFTGVITYASDYDKVIKNAPLDRIILETDCPFLSPVPFRGQRNEPANVKYISQRIAEIRGEPFEKIAEITTQNARELFNLTCY